jgi:hypothetical protein
MSPYEAIGRQIKPRRVQIIRWPDGNEYEAIDWPWLSPPRSDGKPVRRNREVWRPG